MSYLPPNTPYVNTVFVSPSGRAESPGSDVASPTTYQRAIAEVQDDTLIWLGPGTYSDGDGQGTQTTTIQANNVTLQSITPGAPSLSVQQTNTLVPSLGFSSNPFASIEDQVVINGRRDIRFVGLRFSGDISEQGSPGPIFFSNCSGSGVIARTNPSGNMSIVSCAFGGRNYVTSGSGGGSLTITGGGSAAFGEVLVENPGHSTQVFNVSRVGKITYTQPGPAILAQLSNILDDDRPIDAPGTFLSLVAVTCGDTQFGLPRPLTGGDYLFQGVTYDEPNSTLGSPAAFARSFFSQLAYVPEDLADWSGNDPRLVSEAINRIARQIGPIA